MDFEVPTILGRHFLATERVLVDIESSELKFRLNEEVKFIVCQSVKQPGDMSVVSFIDIADEDELVITITEKFVTETLAAVLMNFDGEGIEKYDKTVCALTGICSCSYAPKKLDLDLKNKPTPPAKPSIEELPELEFKELSGNLIYVIFR